MANELHLQDEILEKAWEAKEKGISMKEYILNNEQFRIKPSTLDNMIENGFLNKKDGKINLSEKGEKKAAKLIRAHRLAERLFIDVLDIKEEFLESNACTFEHILSLEICTAICTLLGHPTECPHGNPIPPGDCCKNNLKEIQKLVHPLSELKQGDKGKILYISTQFHNRLDSLIGLGISPGNEAVVHQTFPTYVIRVGETDVALDINICKDIFVRKIL